VLVATVFSLGLVGLGIRLYTASLNLNGDSIAGDGREGSSVSAEDGKESDSVSAEARKGLTFVEILFTAVILAAVVGPFYNMNFTERATAVRNRERIQAYSLAREKLEELRCIPVRKLQSDWELYRGRGPAPVSNIFRNEFFGIWAQIDDNQDTFWANMSDIITVKRKCCGDREMPAEVFEHFKSAFRNYYGFDYEPYPESYSIFRRVTRVRDLTDKKYPGNVLKLVTVTVEIRSVAHRNGYKIQLAAYLGGD
jgi:hypothetical protein